MPVTRIVLASTSPRRKALLEEAGVAIEAIDPGVDDADLDSGTPALAQWVASLSYLKAVAGARVLRARGESLEGVLVIGADTLVDVDGRVLTKPRDGADARDMIRLVRNREHEVLTGVTLLQPFAGTREIFTDRVSVRMGEISDHEIDRYVATGKWAGKAGGYNLTERTADGWPITVEGEPGTVMGMPVKRVVARLRVLSSGAFANGAVSSRGAPVTGAYA